MQDGVVAFLATNLNTTSTRVNPASYGFVTANRSSTRSDDNVTDATCVFNANSSTCTTGTMLYAWWLIDFTVAYRVRPTAYTLRDGFAATSQMPRSFDVLASNDKVRWDLLKRHVNDVSIKVPLGNATWVLNTPPVEKAYRYFLINQTDRNAGGLYFLSLSGFEIFGTLFGA